MNELLSGQFTLSSILLAALIILGAVNLFAFTIFGLDKVFSQNGMWRIREDNLLLLAFIGGWPAILVGRAVFRHKTRKQPFVNRLYTVIGLEVILLVAGMLWWL